MINYWNNLPLKNVSYDDQFLYVSNYLKEIRIPLSEADEIKATGGTGWWRWLPKRVIVQLRTPSAFGRRVIFIPGYYDSEVVRDLRAAVDTNGPCSRLM